MANGKQIPASKPVAKSGGLPDGNEHSTLTTGKNLNMRNWGDKKTSDTIFGKK